MKKTSRNSTCADCGREAELARVPNGRRVCLICSCSYDLPSITPGSYRREYRTARTGKAVAK